MSTLQENGRELPYAAGILKLRIPFVHYRIEYHTIVE